MKKKILTEAQKEKNRANYEKYMEKLKADPERFAKWKEKNRLRARAFRKKEKENGGSYFDDYFKNVYLNDQYNYQCHLLRTYYNNARRYLRLNGRLGPARQFWISIFEAIDSKPAPADSVLDHIISLPYIVRFNMDIPVEVCFDPINLQKISRAENSSKRDTIPDEALEIAKKLENKYPEILEGFAEYLASAKKEIVK